MSAPTSPSSRSPRSASDHTAEADRLISGFDGERDILRAWSRGITPDPLLTVPEWADRHRLLSSRASAEPGRYRTDRTPYMRDIMDALSQGHPAQRMVFMEAAQVGATEAGNFFIGYAIVARGPAIVSKAALVFDASVNLAAEITAKGAAALGAVFVGWPLVIGAALAALVALVVVHWDEIVAVVAAAADAVASAAGAAWD